MAEGILRGVAARGWRRWAIDMALIAGAVVSLVFEPFSIAIHSVAGLAFAGLVGPHLWHRRRWIAGAFRRRGRRSRKPRLGRAQAVVLAVLVIVMTASGLWDWLDARTKIRVHAISGLILVGVVTWHAWTRRRWLSRRTMSDPGRNVDSREPDRSSLRAG